MPVAGIGFLNKQCAWERSCLGLCLNITYSLVLTLIFLHPFSVGYLLNQYCFKTCISLEHLEKRKRAMLKLVPEKYFTLFKLHYAL